MQSGKFALGILAGVLLGLVVVGTSGLGSGVLGSLTSSPGVQVGATEGAQTVTRSAITTSTPPDYVSGSNSTATITPGATSSENQTDKGLASPGFSPVSSRLDSISRQPLATTGYVLLPIFAAFLFGLVLYGASRVRNKNDEETES